MQGDVATAGSLAPAEADRATLRAAITLALTIPGDTVLYLLLPLYAASFGVSLFEAGLLLAANRLIRIVAYGPIARLYARLGPRLMVVAAAVAAVGATAAYATADGLWLLLLARLAWGLSFATQNLANQALATAISEGAVRRSGRARSIIASGSMAGLVGGAVLAELYGPRAVFFVLTAISLAAPLVALALPSKAEVIARGGGGISRPSAMSIWAFCFGFALDGIFVFGLALIARSSFEKGAVLAAGAVMALRYGSEMVLSPASGSLAERFGALPLLVGLSLAIAATFCVLGSSGIVLWVAVVLATVLRALAQPLPPPVIAELYPGPARVPALARQAIWRDIGAGAGPLAAGALFPVAPVLAIWIGTGAVLAAASLLLRWERPDTR